MGENFIKKSRCYICQTCHKEYASHQSLCNHLRRIHKPKSVNIPQNVHTIPQKGEKIPQNTTIFHTKNECKYCKKVLSRYDSLKRHETNCKEKNKIILENNEKNNLIEKLENNIKTQGKLLENLIKIINEQCKVHPKTLQKMNKSLLNSNNTTNNNVNNGTINDNKVITNNIKIIKFGHEDLGEILSEKEILNILNKKYLSIEESIKAVHFNKNRPEYQNVCITNLRLVREKYLLFSNLSLSMDIIRIFIKILTCPIKDDLAYIYNGEKFEAISKTMMLNELIDIHTENIEVTLGNYKKKLTEKTIDILEKLINKINDDTTEVIDENNCKKFKNYKSYKANDIKLLIYNEGGLNNKMINLKCTKFPITNIKEIKV